ncbi:MAG: Fe-S cluster assembly protein NifU [Lentisphaeria bacterium]|jgi:NifU-like protein
MWNYTQTVMDHFMNPRNVGEIPDADGIGEVGNIVCGDAMKLYIKLAPDGKTIADVKFQTFGCASAIASASALTEMVKGKTLEEAAKFTNQDIADFLGELPEEKMHCSVMGMEALQAALANMRTKNPALAAPDVAQFDPEGLDRIVCHCFGVSERKIREVIEHNKLTSVDQVTHYCKAGGGCGGCRDEIAGIIAKIRGIPTPAPAAEAPATPRPLTNLQKIKLVQETFERAIRPALQADGGDAELVDIDGDRVLVRLCGRCAACPSAHQTLKQYIEAKLREKLGPALNVEEVRD